MLASATISEPASAAELLTGLPAEAVTEDAAPHGAVTFAMWEPPMSTMRGEADAPLRRSVVAETAGMLADLVRDGVPALAFIRSRRGAEAAAAAARSRLTETGAADLAHRSRPTGPAIPPRSGATSKKDCAAARSPHWQPRLRSSSASTSLA